MMAHISRAVLLVCVAVATGLGAGLCQDAVDDMEQLVVAHPSLPWPEWRIPNHPLGPIVRSILGGEVGPQPAWKLPMLVNGLQKEPMICTITGYSSQSAGGGGGVYTRWGSRVKWGICAADPHCWGPGSVIWMGPPVNTVLVVEDTGGAIKGPHRFDVCCEGHPEMVTQIGMSPAVYVALHRTPPKANWGVKPAGWHPPIWTSAQEQ